MELYTHVLNNMNQDLTCNMWSVLKELDYNFVFSAEISSPHIVVSNNSDIDEMLQKGKLKKGNRSVKIYTGSVVEDSPFYFDKGVVYFGGAFESNPLIPIEERFMIKTRNSIDSYLNNFINTTKEGSYIFTEYGQISSMNVQKYENKTVFHGFISISPDVDNVCLIGLSDCHKKKTGKIPNADSKIIRNEIVSCLPFLDDNFVRTKIPENKEKELMNMIKKAGSSKLDRSL